MNTSNYIYHHGEHELIGYLADPEEKDPKPGVLVVHGWAGRDAFVCQKAELLASMGYVGFAVDMYGGARIGESIAERKALMEPLLNDRALLRERITAALDALTQLSEVDHERIAVIGFCFGGLCALDLARSGAKIKGAISFHGLLNNAKDLPCEVGDTKILALHGYDDPMVSPEDVRLFCDEMTKANADWQMHMYGLTQHAFTNPEANDKALGTVYNKLADQRSLIAMTQFLQEIFG